MILFLLFVSLSVVIEGRSQGYRSIFPTGKIVGGSPVNITAVPWQVALEDSSYFFCGGSIISANYVLTAAHCTDGTDPRYITVRYGSDTLQSGGHAVKVRKISQNTGFTQANLDYDVSILELEEQITFSNSAQPITLRIEEAYAGENATVTGWGTLQEGTLDLPNVLQQVTVPVVSRNVCNGPYAGVITDRMICAGEIGKDSCQGDSGGALIIGNKQAGIVSWGYGCAEEEYPGVYTNVVALKDYIDQQSNNEAKWD